MSSRLMKSFTVAVFSIFALLISAPGLAKEGDGENGDHKKKSFDAQEIIFGHVLDAHEFHFFDITGKDGKVTPIGIPLPVILYSPQRGLDVFMSSKFEHGHKAYKGYRVLDKHYLHDLEKAGVDVKKEGLSAGKVIPVDGNGNWDRSIKFYDVSLTRNVV
ncbi:MAG TPA: hypothetical protein VIP56_02360, partial [Nitrososphaeraceae archaeon]